MKRIVLIIGLIVGSVTLFAQTQPTSADNTVAVNEDSDLVIVQSDFSFSDATDGNAFVTVNIVTTTTVGVLFDDANLDGIVDGGETLGDGSSISVTNIGLNRLKFKPVANGNGTSYDSFTFQVVDDGTSNQTSATQTMTIDVNAVNDVPSFSLPGSPNQTVAENSGAQTVTAFATSISDGDGGGQTLTFNVSNDNTGIFAAGDQPDINESTGNLTFTPETNQWGKALVTVSLSDNGGIASGGVDQSGDQTFYIYITPTGIVINEVDPTDTGGDPEVSGEFVEIYDGGTGSTALDGLVLVWYNGSDDLTYADDDLDGLSTDANGYFVAGDAGVNNLDYDWGASPDLQNGPDAVALYVGDGSDFVNGDAITLDGLVDVIVYNGSDTELETGFSFTSVDEDGNGDAANESLARIPNGSGSFTASTPTPGAPNTNDYPTAASFNAFGSISNFIAIGTTNLSYSDANALDHIALSNLTISSGALFLDDGGTTGVAGNGIQDGDESTLSNGSTVSKADLDNSYVVYSTTSSTGNETFDFTVNDGFTYSLSTYTATLYSVENALDFDGTDDKVTLGDDASIQPSAAFTLEAWIYPTTVTGDHRILTKYSGTGSAAGELTFDLLGDDLRILLFDGGMVSATAADVLSINTWYHVAARYDGGNTLLELYLNGSLVAQNTSAPATITDVATSWTIGEDAAEGSNPEYFQGLIDNVRIWTTTRLASDIRSSATTRLSSGTGLGASYLFDNGIAGGTNTGLTTLSDETGTNDGTLSGFALSGSTSNWVSSNAFASAAPEIRVTDGSSNEIGDGGSFTFGAFNVALGASQSETITIHNDGLADLNITSTGDIAVSNTAFTVDQTGLSFPLAISAGGSATFDIDWTAAAETVVSESETLTINSDDGDEATFDFTVTGYVVENALDFDGTDDRIVITGASNLQRGSSDQFTIEMWVYPTTTGTRKYLLDEDNHKQFVYLEPDGQIGVVYRGSLESKTNGSSPLTFDEWHHIAISYDGLGSVTGIKVYFDGVLQSMGGSGTISSSASEDMSSNYYIGDYYPGSGSYKLDGNLDEFRIWDVERSASEIRSNAASRISLPNASLLLYYDFNQGIPSGDNTGLVTITDLSSNGYDGTATNFEVDGSNNSGNTSNWIASTAFASSAATTPSIAVYDETGALVADASTFTFASTGFGLSTDTTFTIINEGLADLSLSSDAVLTQDTTYALVTPYSSPVTVTPGASQDLTVSFDPFAAANYTDVLTIANSDAGSNPYVINLSGDGLDLSAPVFENSTPQISAITTTGFTIETDIDEAGVVYYVVVPANATAPNLTEIQAGQASGGGSPEDAGNFDVSGVTDFIHDFVVTGLSVKTAYDVYVFAEDDEGTPNEQASATLIEDVTTAGNNSTLSAVASSEAGFFNSSSYDADGSGSSFTNTNSIQVFQFDIDDETGDGLPTILSDIDITIASTDHTDVKAIGLSTDGGSTFIAETPVSLATETLTISGGLAVADNSSATVSVFVSFNASPTEEQYQFSVSGYSQPTSGTTTISTASVSSSTAGDENTVDNSAPQVSSLEIFDADHDGLIERIDITFSEIVSVVSGPVDLSDFGDIILATQDTVKTTAGLGISGPSGDPSVISITNIVDQLSINTGVGGTRIANIAGLWQDQAGNAIVDNSETVIDSADPVLASSSPLDGSVSFSPADIVLHFSEKIQFGGSGTVVLNETSPTPGTQFTYDVTSPGLNLVISNDSTLTIESSSVLVIPRDYDLVVSSDAIDELGGARDFAGITISFTANNIQPDDCAYNYESSRSGENNAGNLSSSVCNTSPSTTASSLYVSESEAVTVLYFNMMDGGGSESNFTNMTFSNGGATDWSKLIEGAVLIDQNGKFEYADAINSTNIQFTGMAEGEGDIADVNSNQDKEYALRVWFKTDLTDLASSIDNTDLIFQINQTGAGAVRVWNGSTSYVDNTSIYVSNTVTFQVVATHYGFAQQPTETEANSAMYPFVTVQAEDVYGSRDADYITSEVLTIGSTGASLSGTPLSTNGTFVAGVTEMADSIVFDYFESSIVLNTSGGALDNTPTSDAFNIICDATPPIISAAAISLSGSPSGQSSTYAIGDNITAYYDNKVDKNDNLRHITFDFSEFGGGSFDVTAPTVAADSIYEYTYTIVAGSVEVSNGVNVLVSGTDSADDDPEASCTDNTSPNTSGTEDVSVDNQRPTITLFNPLDETTTGILTNQDIEVTFSEDVLSSFGTINLVANNGVNSQSFSANSASNVSIASSVATLDPTNAFAGGETYNVIIDANSFTDIHGNAFSGTILGDWNFTVDPDTQAPTLDITVSTPASGTTSRTNSTSLEFILSFDEPISGIDETDIALVANGLSGSESFALDQINTQTYRVTVSNLAIATAGVDGDIAVQVTNTSGKIDDGAMPTPNEFTTLTSSAVVIDQTKPVVTATSLNTLDGTPPLAGTVDENVAVSVLVNGVTYSATVSGSGPYTWDIADDVIDGDVDPLTFDGGTPLPEGTYTITVSAADEAGNTGQGTGTLKIDQTAPTIVGTYFFDTGTPDGIIDEILVIFNENVLDSSVDPNDFTFSGAASVALATTINHPYVSSDQVDDDWLTFEVTGYTEGTATSNVDYTQPLTGGLSDLVGNLLDTADALIEYDYALPLIVQTYQYDINEDGRLDEIVVEFTEGVRFSSVNASAYSVLNSTLTSALAHTSVGNTLDQETLDEFITLSVDVPGTDTTRVSYDASVATRDASSSSNAAPLYTNIPALDRALPVVMDVNSLTDDSSVKIIGDAISIYIDFSETVDVTGTPTLDLSTVVTGTATYSGGDGTTRLSFDYTVSAGQESSDLDYSGSTALSGTIDDQSPQNNAGSLELPVPAASGSLSNNKEFIIDGVIPYFVQAHFYDVNPIDGDIDEIVIEMSEPVNGVGFQIADFDLAAGSVINVINQNGGSAPAASNTLDVSATDKYVTLSVSISGSYPEAITYDGASIVGIPNYVQDIAGNSVATGSTPISTLIDVAPPRVQSVRSSVSNGTYGIGQLIPIQVIFSEDVTVSGSGLAPTIRLETGTFDQQVNYSSTDSDTLFFNYTVSEGDYSTDKDYLDYTANNALQSNEQTIKDLSNLTSINTLPEPLPTVDASLGTNKQIIIDGVRPTFVSAEEFDTDNNGTIDRVSITMSEPVNDAAVAFGDFTLGSGVTPTSIVSASGVNGDGSATDNIITLAVTSTESSSFTVGYSGTSVQDLAGNTANSNSSISVTDLADPIILSVTSSIGNGAYNEGDLIPIQVTFSEVVSYTTGATAPSIALATGATTVSQDAVLASGNGTKILVFEYTVQADDESADLNYVNVDALSLNTGTITDQASRSIATSNEFTYASANSQSLADLKDIIIDTQAPGITTLTISSDNAITSLAKGDDPENEDGTGIAADVANVVTISMDFDDDLFEAPTVQVRGDDGALVLNSPTINIIAPDQYTAVYTVSRNDSDGPVTFTIDYTDKAGNSGTQLNQGDITSGSNITTDNTNPTVEFTVVDDPTSEATFTVSAQFDEPVTLVELSDFTTSNGVLSNLNSLGGNEYEFDVTPVADQTNTLTIGISDESVTDLTGNTIVNTTFDVDFDDQAPNILSNISDSVVVYGQDLTVTLNLDEVGTLYYALVPNGTAATNAEVKAQSIASAIAEGSINYGVANVDQELPLTLPQPRTEYDLLLVSEDKVDPTPYNLSAVTIIDVTSGGVVLNNPNLNNFCLEGDFYTLDPITITETIATDFVSPKSSANRTFRLVLPDIDNDGTVDFQFNTTAGTESVSVSVGDLANVSLNFTSSSILTITYQVPTEDAIDVMTISGLQIKATGNTSSNAQIERSGGNGNIYLANEGDGAIFATLNTVEPYAEADIVTAIPTPAYTNPYLFEWTSGVQEDALGDGVTVFKYEGLLTSDTVVAVGLPNVGDSVKFYSDAGLTTVSFKYEAVTNFDTLYVTLADLGLATTDVGVNTYYVTTKNGLSCESASIKYSAAIIRFENSESKTGYAVNNGTGTTLKYSFPAGHTRLFVGNGLTSYQNDDDFADAPADGMSVKFIPSAAEKGTHTIIYQLTNTASGVTANYGVDFLVIESDVVLSTDISQEVDYCEYDDPVSLTMVCPDGIECAGEAVTSEPNFKTVRVYLYDSDTETRGTEVTTDVLTTIPASDPNDTTGWTFNPQATVVTDLLVDDVYSQELLFVYVIEDDVTSEETDLSEQIITIYRDPTVSFTNMNDYYCNDDGNFDVRVTIISAAGTQNNVAIDTFRIYKYDSISLVYEPYGADSGWRSGANFNPADPDNDGVVYGLNASNEEDYGGFRIEYATDSLTNAECTSTITYDFQILKIPDLPSLDETNFASHSDGDISGTYTIEYCAGETVDNLVVDLTGYSSNVEINWYNDVLLNSPIASTHISGTNSEELDLATAFFGGNNEPTGRQNITFYYTITDNIGINSSSYSGCESESKTVSLQVYPYPDQVVAESLVTSTTTNTSNSKSVTGEYFYEYCQPDGVAATLSIDLDETLNTEDASESYFILYDSTQTQVARFQDADTLTDTVIKNIFSYSALDSTSLVFYVSQRNFDNNYPSGSSQFSGCEGELRKFTINVNAIPNTPEAEAFNGDEVVDGVVKYYLCSGDQLQNILTPQLTGAKYNWYLDDGTTSPSSTVINNVAAFNDNFITRNELAAVGFNNVVTSKTTYTYWVTQTVEANTASGFKGCESDTLQVDIVVSPDPATPTVTDVSSSGLIDDSGTYRASYCEGSVDFIYEVSGLTAAANGGELVRFNVYSVTNGGQLSTTAIYTDTTSTGSIQIDDLDLRMSAQDAGTYTFKISQVNSTVGGSDDNATFTGCETEEADMATVVLYIYDVPDEPEIGDDPTNIVSDGADDMIYYNEGDAIANLVVNGESGINNIYRWYNADTNVELLADTTDAGVSTASAAQLGISGAGVYNFYVDQTADYSQGVPDFLGCTSAAEEFTVTVFALPNAPIASDPDPQCDFNVSPGSTEIRYSGVSTTNNTTTQFLFVNSYTGVTTTVDVIDPTFTLVQTVNGVENAVDEGVFEFTVDVIQVTNRIANEFNGSTSNPTEVTIVTSPIPTIGDFGPSKQFNVIEACDNALITLDLKLTNLSVNNATFEWEAGLNSNTTESIDTLSMTYLSDSTVRFEFDPVSNNLSGDRHFSVSVNNKNRPAGLPSNQCVAEAGMNFEIGTSPIPKLRWEGITEGRRTTLTFGDDNTSTSSNYWVDSIYVEVPSVNWSAGASFGQGAVDRDNLWVVDSTIFNSAGTYDINVTYISGSACVGELTRTITILDHFVITDDILFEFEGADDGDWFVEYTDGFEDRDQAWEIGSASFDDNTDGNGSYWVTGDGTSYSGGTQSWVYSPSFDLSGMDNPTVGFAHIRDFTFTDGVVLQQSLDDGRTWQPVGSYQRLNQEQGLGSGKNWYNTQEISGAPGSEDNFNPTAFAWSNASEDGWATTAHRISDLHSQIRFRFALGSTTGDKIANDKTPLDGFAFDDFSIYNKEKFILIEQFSDFSASSVEAIDSITSRMSTEISTDAILLNYYVGNLDINGRTASDPAARSSYYGVDSEPQSIISGVNVNDEEVLEGLNDVTGWTVNYYNSRALDQALFTIGDISLGTDPSTLDISTTFTYSSQGDVLPEGTELSFRFAVVEKEIVDPELMALNGGNPLRNVLRKMLPSTGGFTYKGRVTPGQSVFFNGSSEIEASWGISEIYDADQLMVIAFVQVDNLPSTYTGTLVENRLILQAKAVDVSGKIIPEVTGVDRIAGIDEFEIYPNPANRSFKVQLENAPDQAMDWVIYDQVGRQVKLGAVKPGELEIEVDARDLPSGVYLIHLFNDEEKWKPKRLVIIH